MRVDGNRTMPSQQEWSVVMNMARSLAEEVSTLRAANASLSASNVQLQQQCGEMEGELRRLKSDMHSMTVDMKSKADRIDALLQRLVAERDSFADRCRELELQLERQSGLCKEEQHSNPPTPDTSRVMLASDTPHQQHVDVTPTAHVMLSPSCSRFTPTTPWAEMMTATLPSRGTLGHSAALLVTAAMKAAVDPSVLRWRSCSGGFVIAAAVGGWWNWYTVAGASLWEALQAAVERMAANDTSWETPAWCASAAAALLGTYTVGPLHLAPGAVDDITRLFPARRALLFCRMSNTGDLCCVDSIAHLGQEVLLSVQSVRVAAAAADDPGEQEVHWSAEPATALTQRYSAIYSVEAPSSAAETVDLRFPCRVEPDRSVSIRLAVCKGGREDLGIRCQFAYRAAESTSLWSCEEGYICSAPREEERAAAVHLSGGVPFALLQLRCPCGEPGDTVVAILSITGRTAHWAVFFSFADTGTAVPCDVSYQLDGCDRFGRELRLGDRPSSLGNMCCPYCPLVGSASCTPAELLSWADAATALASASLLAKAAILHDAVWCSADGPQNPKELSLLQQTGTATVLWATGMADAVLSWSHACDAEFMSSVPRLGTILIPTVDPAFPDFDSFTNAATDALKTAYLAADFRAERDRFVVQSFFCAAAEFAREVQLDMHKKSLCIQSLQRPPACDASMEVRLVEASALQAFIDSTVAQMSSDATRQAYQRTLEDLRFRTVAMNKLSVALSCRTQAVSAAEDRAAALAAEIDAAMDKLSAADLREAELVRRLDNALAAQEAMQQRLHECSLQLSSLRNAGHSRETHYKAEISALQSRLTELEDALTEARNRSATHQHDDYQRLTESDPSTALLDSNSPSTAARLVKRPRRSRSLVASLPSSSTVRRGLPK